MNRKLSSLALAAVLAGSGLAGCGGANDAAATGSNAAVKAAVRASAKEMDPSRKTETEDEREEAESSFVTLLNQLRQLPQLAPLFDQFQVPNPIVMDDDARSTGLIDLLHAVRFSVSDGTLTLTNRATGGLIFTAPLADLASGVLHPENLPGATTTPPPTGGTCTSFTYSPWSACSATGTQTRTVLTASPAGCTGGSPVTTQTCTPPAPTPAPTCSSFTYSPWSACDPATSRQTRTVLSSSPAGCTGGTPVTTQACTPPPATCTSFTYSAWSACDPATSTQTRTVLSSSPAGCTGGTPATTQACTPALDGAALYGQYCSRCHGTLATSNLKGRNISVALIKQFNMTQGLTDAQLQAIVTAVGP